MDPPIWDVTVFTKKRERLLAGEVAARFMGAVLGQERVQALLSDEHFSVDGTLIGAWASIKSFRPKDGDGDDQPPVRRNGERNFRGEQRSNDSQASTTDPDARLFQKAPGQAAKLAFMAVDRHGIGTPDRRSIGTSLAAWGADARELVAEP